MKIFLKIIGASIFLITAVCLLACTINISDPVHEHKWVVKEKKDATCSEPGSITYICETDNETKTDIVPAIGHKNVETNVDSFTNSNYSCKKNTCSNCDYSEYELTFLKDDTKALFMLDSNNLLTTFNYKTDKLNVEYKNNKLKLVVNNKECEITDDNDYDSMSLNMILKVIELLPDEV